MVKNEGEISVTRNPKKVVAGIILVSLNVIRSIIEDKDRYASWLNVC